MSNVLLQMFVSKSSHRQIANEIANKFAGGIKSKTKFQSKYKLFSKYISIFDLFSKQIESKNIGFYKFIVDEYSRKAL
ncbi:MAG TPA: hypothetical protein DHE23_08520 [Agrobacterium sp.]|nr:hypothetical protein [Agrobacterium sp.]